MPLNYIIQRKWKIKIIKNILNKEKEHFHLRLLSAWGLGVVAGVVCPDEMAEPVGSQETEREEGERTNLACSGHEIKRWYDGCLIDKSLLGLVTDIPETIQAIILQYKRSKQQKT